MPELKSKNRVEIFSAGVWNGDPYTVEDLDEMVRAFNDNKHKIQPHLKLGHDKDQKLIQEDGFPAAGWINNLYRMGSKLYADFIDIPAKIFSLIENKAYKKVSSEIFWNVNINGKKYKRALAAVSLLGSDWPAVTNLDDILAMYGIKDYDKISNYSENNDNIKKVYNFINEDESMPNELDELKKELDEAKQYSKKLEEDAKLKKEEDEKLANELKEYKKKLEIAEQVNKEANLDKYIADLEKENLATPAMRPYIKELFGEEKKEYSFTVKTGENKEEEKKFKDKRDLFKETLHLFKAADVNLDEGSSIDDKGNEFDEVAEVNRLMKEKNYTLQEATSEVLKIVDERKKGA